ncbi:Uncharacterized membrane protein [Halogranum rubrum]|uniref:Uncharacterized membrane protein n=1 Tax=Halogranum rubrum TaxID=553466 RepID=A0A1I4B394_9EURY|nr:Uncharacterized membrane protein [Halogranum rubrum]
MNRSDQRRSSERDSTDSSSDDVAGHAEPSSAETTFDPSDEQARTLGRGFFEETSAPGSAMAHLYRGEIHRMKMWRERLDRSSNWAVTVMAAILTWAFADASNPHYVILVGALMVGIFLVIEARRYRGYDIWRSRVRLLQENVFAYALDPSQGIEDDEWRRKLSRDYRTPTTKITYEEAIAHRLRRVYLPLFTVLGAAWLFRITVMPTTGWPASAAIGMIPGAVVTGLVITAYLGLVSITFRPRRWQAHGELRNCDIGAWDEME